MDMHSNLHVIHTFYQKYENQIPNKIVSRMVDWAMVDSFACQRADPLIFRLNSTEPRCFAPQVDITRARQAYGKWAMPKLERELHSKDINVVRQAVTTIADLIANPEEMVSAIGFLISGRLVDLLISEDPYLRERVAMIYGTVSQHAVGRDAILQSADILHHLKQGLVDPLAVIRLKIAKVIETLARYSFAAEDLCENGFLELILNRIDLEKNILILTIHLEILESMLNGNAKEHAIEIGMMDKLVALLENNDDNILAAALSCLAVICQVPIGKEKCIDMDLMSIFKDLLNNQSREIHKKAAGVIMFATITTPGKLRAVELQIADRLVELAADFHDRELQLVSMKALSNIAEAPKGRSMLLESYSMFIEDIDTHADEVVKRHKNILLEIIRWRS